MSSFSGLLAIWRGLQAPSVTAVVTEACRRALRYLKFLGVATWALRLMGDVVLLETASGVGKEKEPAKVADGENPLKGK